MSDLESVPYNIGLNFPNSLSQLELISICEEVGFWMVKDSYPTNINVIHGNGSNSVFFKLGNTNFQLFLSKNANSRVIFLGENYWNEPDEDLPSLESLIIQGLKQLGKGKATTAYVDLDGHAIKIWDGQTWVET